MEKGNSQMEKGNSQITKGNLGLVWMTAQECPANLLALTNTLSSCLVGSQIFRSLPTFWSSHHILRLQQVIPMAAKMLAINLAHPRFGRASTGSIQTAPKTLEGIAMY